jgi:hypothetical protein
MAIVKLRNVRIAFCQNLFEPGTFAGQTGDAKYSSTFLIPKDDPQVKAVQAVMQTVANDKWGNKAAKILDELIKGERVCMRDGDNKDQYDGFAGCMCISASNKQAPKVLDRDKSILSKDNGKPYAGCYVVCSLEIWAQDNQYGKRINATLRGVQFMADGDAFVGSGPVKDDEFDNLADVGDDLA